LFRNTDNSAVATLVQLVVDNFVVTATPGSKPRIKPIRFPGQHSVHTAASFVGSDWVRDTWALNFWVESTAFGVMNVVGVVVSVCSNTWSVDSDVLQVPKSESSFDDASVLRALAASTVSISALGFQIGVRTEEIVRSVRNGLSIAIGDSVFLGVHLNAFVRVDQVSASFVQIVDYLTMS
jgi:hypothetical protein